MARLRHKGLVRRLTSPKSVEADLVLIEVHLHTHQPVQPMSVHLEIPTQYLDDSRRIGPSQLDFGPFEGRFHGPAPWRFAAQAAGARAARITPRKASGRFSNTSVWPWLSKTPSRHNRRRTTPIASENVTSDFPR